MKAHYITTNPGNIAIEAQVWELDNDARKAVLKHFANEKPGSYWYNHVVKPLRSRKGHKRIYTGGFTSGEFSNILFNIGIEVVYGFTDSETGIVYLHEIPTA